MNAEKTPKQNRKQEFLRQIESKVDEGQRRLEDQRLRLQVENLLMPQFTVETQASPREFMIALTDFLLSYLADPASLSRLKDIGAHLQPLKEIEEIVSRNEFNDLVAVRGQDRIKDPRQPLKEFQLELNNFLRRDKRRERR